MEINFTTAACAAAKAAFLALWSNTDRTTVQLSNQGQDLELPILSCSRHHEEAHATVAWQQGTVTAVAGKVCGCTDKQIDVQGHSSLAVGRLDNKSIKLIQTTLLPLLNNEPQHCAAIIFIKEGK